MNPTFMCLSNDKTSDRLHKLTHVNNYLLCWLPYCSVTTRLIELDHNIAMQAWQKNPTEGGVVTSFVWETAAENDRWIVMQCNKTMIFTSINNRWGLKKKQESHLAVQMLETLRKTEQKLVLHNKSDFRVNLVLQVCWKCSFLVDST